jgi:hypothetical protein
MANSSTSPVMSSAGLSDGASSAAGSGGAGGGGAIDCEAESKIEEEAIVNRGRGRRDGFEISNKPGCAVPVTPCLAHFRKGHSQIQLSGKSHRSPLVT